MYRSSCPRISPLDRFLADHPSMAPRAGNPSGTGQKHPHLQTRNQNENVAAANVKSANALGKKRTEKRKRNARSGHIAHEATTIPRRRCVTKTETRAGGARVKVAHEARARVLHPRRLACRRARSGSKSLLLWRRSSLRLRTIRRCHHQRRYQHMATWR